MKDINIFIQVFAFVILVIWIPIFFIIYRECVNYLIEDIKKFFKNIKPEPKIKEGKIFIDPTGKYQKFERVLFYSSFYNEFCIMFDSGKTEYESTILNEWTRTDLEHIPGEQTKLF
jgi:hypothetical protein